MADTNIKSGIVNLSSLEDRIQRDLLSGAALFNDPYSAPSTVDKVRASLIARDTLERNRGNIEMYKKIRADNIALSHETAIELVRMINLDAATLTGKEFE